MFTGSEQLSKSKYKGHPHHCRCSCSNQGISCVVESTRKFVKSYCQCMNYPYCYDVFGATGSYIFESALGETLCQLGMYEPGVMNKVLCGKLCNRCQTLNKTFAITIERFYVQLMYPKSCRWRALLTLKNLVRLIVSLEFVKKYLTDYQSVKDNALADKSCSIFVPILWLS